LLRLGVALALLAVAGAARAADPADDVTASTQRARNGGGLRIGSWRPDEPAGMSHTGAVAFQGWFEKGLDLHLAWENTLGYWRRTSTWSETDLTGTTTHEIQTHLVPTLTSLRLYPLTTPSNRVEPFMSAGVGVVLGFQQEKVSGNVATSGSAATMHTGLGVQTGLGVDVRANDAFGLTLGGHFGSASFGEDMPGQRLFQAWGADAGLTYRFQYR
jgi:opacity protein-like surface antigen